MEWVSALSSVNCYLSGNPVHDGVMHAFYDGVDCDKSLREVKDYEISDVAVVFGIRKKAFDFSKYRGHIFDEQCRQGRKVIVLETGYVRRGNGASDYYAAGYGGINGRADFRNQKSPSDRWERLGVTLKPWRSGGEYILLCGQVPWDASVDFTDHVAWLTEAVDRIKASSNLPIVFRPHPLAQHIKLARCKTSTAGLDEDLSGALSAMTFNSNTGVDAAVAGVPVFIDDIGAMSSPVANKNWVRLNDPDKPDRTQWANNIAYAQWTPDEMRAGLAWSHLSN